MRVPQIRHGIRERFKIIMPTEQYHRVASGSYYTSRQKPLILDVIPIGVFESSPELALRQK